MKFLFVVTLTLGLLACGKSEEPGQTQQTTDLKAEAKRIARENIIIDTHIDVPYRLENSYEDVSVATESGDFDYPRARAGGLDAPFMSIYIPARYQETGGAKELADQLIDMMYELEKKSPDKFMVAKSVADVQAAFTAGKIALPMGMENGAPVGNDLAKLAYFHSRGIRYITLAHSKSNLISDSSYDENKQHGGLSDFGKQVVMEMNQLGIMVDVSHLSDAAFYDVMAISKVPVIASHSSPRHFTPDWERNMDDDMIKLLAEKGGVIHINIGSAFLTPEANAYNQAESDARNAWLEENDLEDNGENRSVFSKQYRAENPYPYATLEQTLDVFDYAVKLAGIDHVGIGTDYDGVGDSLPEGLKDVSTYPNLIEGLLRRGYSEQDIIKILSGNLLRVWSEVETYANTHGGGTSLDGSLLWLEDIEGEKPLAWVGEKNRKTLTELADDPRFGIYKQEALEILTAPDRISYGTLRGDQVYNFWRDKNNVRGVWRRSDLASYKTGSPDWEEVLDVDKLAQEENENWFFKNAVCLPVSGRCILQLAPGGTDAAVYREFDLNTKSFVEDGFVLPLAKSSVAWQDKDTLLVGTNWGEGTLTESGYARMVKRWQRGTPLEQAETVFEAAVTDMIVRPGAIHRSDGSLVYVLHKPSFFSSEYWAMIDDGSFRKLPLPQRARIEGMFQGQILVRLNEDWNNDGEQFRQGSLISFSLADFQKTGIIKSAQLMIEPAANATIGFSSSFTNNEAIQATANAVYVSMLEDVSGHIMELTRENGRWIGKRQELGDNLVVSLKSADESGDVLLVNTANPLQPDQLSLINFQTGDKTLIQSLPSRFNTKGLVVRREKAISEDGTQTPYFIIHRQDLAYHSRNPTLMFGYGGFEIPLLPRYNALTGKLWIEKGGVYVIANIRGGGEYGPRWHQAALLKNRHLAYEDFIAVAEDVQTKSITSPDHMGIFGRSNGGLLMGAMFTQRPDLFKAVICGVPLLDMLRYDKLLAGASWTGEYGDPDNPEMRAYLQTYSPFQKVVENGTYPKVYFFTSTKDDRVHPGHARKMAAKFEVYGHPHYYYENTEGGHAGSANHEQTATMRALEFVYLASMLGNDNN